MAGDGDKKIPIQKVLITQKCSQDFKHRICIQYTGSTAGMLNSNQSHAQESSAYADL